jgi:hypothetical protein
VNITASDVIAAIAILATIVTTSVVAWIGHLDRKGDHEHERTLAREARLQERRAVAYRDMVAMVFRVQDVVDQTLPLFESVPPPPRIPEPTLDEQREMAATVTAFGSAEVVARLRAVVSATRAFHLAVRDLSDVRLVATPSVGGADELRKARENLRAQRADVHAAVDELERAAREELAS